jgi:hypothetical protein
MCVELPVIAEILVAFSALLMGCTVFTFVIEATSFIMRSYPPFTLREYLEFSITFLALTIASSIIAAIFYALGI